MQCNRSAPVCGVKCTCLWTLRGSISIDNAAGLHVPLPVSTEVHGLTAPQRQLRDAPHLIAVGGLTVILAPRALPRIPQEVGAGDVVAMAVSPRLQWRLHPYTALLRKRRR
jgi:hypothetical protein